MRGEAKIYVFSEKLSVWDTASFSGEQKNFSKG